VLILCQQQKKVILLKRSFDFSIEERNTCKNKKK
jgi:hypothetical protein